MFSNVFVWIAGAGSVPRYWSWASPLAVLVWSRSLPRGSVIQASMPSGRSFRRVIR